MKLFGVSAPVDHTPYLRPGIDLVTASDAAEWLDTLHKGPPAERIFGVQDAVAALDARLDRERRQACRRGARVEWQTFACAARCHDKAYAWTCNVCAATLSRALAFRAAARQP